MHNGSVRPHDRNREDRQGDEEHVPQHPVADHRDAIQASSDFSAGDRLLRCVAEFGRSPRWSCRDQSVSESSVSNSSGVQMISLVSPSLSSTSKTLGRSRAFAMCVQFRRRAGLPRLAGLQRPRRQDHDEVPGRPQPVRSPGGRRMVRSGPEAAGLQQSFSKATEGSDDSLFKKPWKQGTFASTFDTKRRGRDSNPRSSF